MDSRSALITRLLASRRDLQVLPGVRDRWEAVARRTLSLLFPHFAGVGGPPPCLDAASLRSEINTLRDEWVQALDALPGTLPQPASAITDRVLDQLPELHDLLLADAKALLAGDPAAETLDEVLLAYPGLHAVAYYRVAHVLHQLREALAPRLVTELAHRETGIDIHPGAVIGPGLAIDHGTGVVIGETSVVGARVKLYQGVTLGAASVRKELAKHKRHPTVGNDVVIYANATILGGDTVIGDGCVIGGNVWLTHSVPAGSLVTLEAPNTSVRAPDVELEYYL
jgi:serine O-acetyltransferase